MAIIREIRVRARQIAPQVLAACLVAYFAFHAVNGDRGFNAWVHLKQELERAHAVRAELRQERASLERRVGLLQPDHLDPDMLEERARLLLNYGRPDDYMVLLPPLPEAEE
jgi:cell division protein FtsB